jgi:hypothetical protein
MNKPMSGRLILTTVGTSAVNRDKLERLYLWTPWQDLLRSLPKSATNPHRVWIDQAPPRNIQRFQESYLQFVSGLFIEEEIEKPKQGGTNVFSAELTSLHLMKLDAEKDHIVLLLSDSPDGVICGLLVRDCLREMFSMTPDMEIIRGLQVENFEQFFEEGLEEFSGTLNRYTDQFSDKAHILNATGGFKSIIPYATYLTLGHNMVLYFVFEEQPNPIVIDPNRFSESVRQAVQEAIREEPMMMRHPQPQW